MARRIEPASLGRGLLFVHLFLSPLLFSTATAEAFEFCKSSWLILVSIILGALCLSAGIDSWKSKPSRLGMREVLSKNLRAIFRDPLCLGFLLFLLSAVVSTIWSISPCVSWHGTHASEGGLRTILGYTVLFFCTRALCRRERDVRRLLLAPVVASALVSTLALVQAAGLDPIAWDNTSKFGSFVRPFATMGHPNVLAGFLAMVVPITLWFAEEYRQAGRWLPWLVCLATGLLSCLAILSTISRSGWLALGCVLVALAVGWSLVGKSKQVRTAILVLLPLAAVVALFVFALLPDRENFLASFSERLSRVGDVSSRRHIWGIALGLFRDHPIAGCGLDTFRLSFGQKRTVAYALSEWNTTPLRAHNEVLHLLATQGVLGLMAGCTITVGLFRTGRRAWRRAAAADKCLVVALIAGFLGYYVQNALGFTVVGSGTLFVTLAAVIGNTRGFVKESEQPEKEHAAPSLAGRGITLSVVWSGAVVLMFYCVVVPVRASMACRRGDCLYQQDHASALDHYERAISLEPQNMHYRVQLAVAAQVGARRALSGEERQNLLTRAREAYDDVLALVPVNSDCHAALGRVLAEMAREKMVPADGAFVEYEEALALDRTNVYYYTDAANAALVLGDLARANRYIERGSELYPRYGVLIAHRGYIAMVEGRYTDALHILLESFKAEWRGEEVCLQFALAKFREVVHKLNTASLRQP